MVKVNEETHDLRPKIPYTLTDPQNVDSEKKAEYIDNGIRTKNIPIPTSMGIKILEVRKRRHSNTISFLERKYHDHVPDPTQHSFKEHTTYIDPKNNAFVK